MNKKTIGILALLSLGGYAYSKGLFTKKAPKIIEPPKPEEKEPVEKEPSPTYNPLADPNSFEFKVAFIQKKLGVKPDGVAGPQTNGAFDKTYGLDKGNISRSNINYYVQRVKNNDTKAKSKEVSGDAFTIKNAYAKGGNLVFKKGGSFSIVEYDAARKLYVSTGTRRGYVVGGAFITPTTFARERTTIQAVTKSGNLIVKVNPVFGSSFLVSVPSSYLIVKN